MRMPESQKWPLDRAKEMMTTPCALREADVPKAIHHKPATQAKLGQHKLAQVRRRYM